MEVVEFWLTGIPCQSMTTLCRSSHSCSGWRYAARWLSG